MENKIEPRPVWVIEDSGESFVVFQLGYEGVAGDPMNYKVPRQYLKRLSINDIPDLAYREGFETWLG